MTISYANDSPRPVPCPEAVSYTHLDVYKRQALTGLTRKYFYRTYNAGANWTSIGSMMSDPTSQLAKISNPAGNAVIYQPVSLGGLTPQGIGKIGLVKLATNGNTVKRADLNGFGSLGTFPTMFKWYNVCLLYTSRCV